MAKRQTTFLLKRSNIPGKIPPSSGLTSGELALNTADAILYTSGSTSGTILPIGWDRVSRTGDTMTGSLYAPSISATTLSAVTLQFDTSYDGTVDVGQIAWDTNFGTLQQGLVGGNVIQRIGETSFALVKNVESTTLNKGEVVYIFGATGDKISVKRASNTGDTTSSKTLGVAAENIASNQDGLIITQGTLDGLNLGSYTAGDILWLSNVPGQFTTVKQYAPNHLVFIGVVQRANNGNGQLYVKPQNGYELDELHNVLATGATYGDLLIYSNYNGSDLWVNSKTLNGSYTITGNTNISGTTTVGGDIITNSTLKSLNSAGDEGGEIFLNKSVTNTSINNGVTVDVYQNRLRFFESGGSNRGVYIDLTAASTGVGTNLLSGGGGEINTASNLGSGTGLFAQKSAADLQFKSLTSTGGTVTISNDANTVNLEVIPASNFTGGTVTGETTFTNGLITNTISATTYQNLPTDVFVTGGTYDNGSLSFKNNTGGTFNIITSSNYAAGVISGATGWSSTGAGQINLPAVKVALYNNSNNIEPIIVYDLAAGTTNSGGIPSLTDNDTNYIVIEYNGGSPIYNVYNNDGVVNDSDVVLAYIVYRLGNFVHVLEFGNQGAGLANKLNDRVIMTERFGWESGLTLGLSGSTGVVTLTSGIAWNGSYRQTLTAVNSQDDIFFKNYHSGGTWTYTTTGDTLNNSYYDNGTDVVLATGGKYLVNYYYRGQETNDHLYEVYGTTQYDSVNEAEAATNPELPELISSHAFLVGRIIVLVGATTGVTQTAFATVFSPSGYVPSAGEHNDLTGLQGGTAGQYYHLTSNQYNNNAYTNVNNNFSTGQTINGTVTVTDSVASNHNSITSDNLITMALLYLSNNT